MRHIYFILPLLLFFLVNSTAIAQLGGWREPDPSVQWDQFDIATIEVADNGDFYVAGPFTEVSGLPNVNYFAKWDGNSWAAATPQPLPVESAYVHDIAFAPGGIIYLAGFFKDANGEDKGVLKWDGTSWTFVSNLAVAVKIAVYEKNSQDYDIYINGYKNISVIDISSTREEIYRSKLTNGVITKSDGITWTKMIETPDILSPLLITKSAIHLHRGYFDNIEFTVNPVNGDFYVLSQRSGHITTVVGETNYLDGLIGGHPYLFVNSGGIWQSPIFLIYDPDNNYDDYNPYSFHKLTINSGGEIYLAGPYYINDDGSNNQKGYLGDHHYGRQINGVFQLTGNTLQLLGDADDLVGHYIHTSTDALIVLTEYNNSLFREKYRGKVYTWAKWDGNNWITTLDIAGYKTPPVIPKEITEGSNGDLIMRATNVKADRSLLPYPRQRDNILIWEDKGCPTNNVIYVDRDARGANDGSSWKNAFTNLSVALDVAKREVCPNLREIWVADGYYSVTTPFVGTYPSFYSANCSSFYLLPDIAIYGGFEGASNPTDSRTLADRDIANNQTLLYVSYTSRCEDEYTVHETISDLTSSDYSTPITNTTILDGFTFKWPIEVGIRLSHSSPLIRNCTFEGIEQPFDLSGTANPTFENCTFSDIKATTSLKIKRGSFTNCTFQDTDNTSLNYLLQISSDVTMNGCTFKNTNASSRKEGKLIVGSKLNTVEDCEFIDNYGTMIYYSSDQNLTLQRNKFTNNTTTNTLVEIRPKPTTSPAITVSNCSFYDNEVGKQLVLINGGPTLSTATIEMLNCTLYNNEYSGSGALRTKNAELDLTNSILYGNIRTGVAGAPQITFIPNTMSGPAISHCIIENSGSSGGSWKTGLGQDMGSNTESDPAFDPSLLIAPLFYLVPDSGSPALDEGDNTVVVGDHDVRGIDNTTTPPTIYERQKDGNSNSTVTIDIGAYERQ